MRVLVTGGTGYVGCHIVAALAKAGHDVRLLVRRPESVAPALEPVGVTVGDVEQVVGDVLDPDVVGRALDGCDAVVHAAAIFALDPRRAAEVMRTNQRATELVVGGAVERGLDPVVHISSTVALTRKGGSGPDLPLGDVDSPYAASKRASEELVRRYQDAGAPVVSVYPGAVWGPHDPYLGVNAEMLTWIVRGLIPMWPRGGALYVDVRDVAAVVTAVIEPGKEPRRFVVPGHHVDGEVLFGALRRLTGRAHPYASMPTAVVVPTTRAIDLLNRLLPGRLHVPADAEGALLVLRNTEFDTSPATEELGVAARPIDETLGDTLRWMVDAGHLKPWAVGTLAR